MNPSFFGRDGFRMSTTCTPLFSHVPAHEPRYAWPFHTATSAIRLRGPLLSGSVDKRSTFEAAAGR